MDLYKPLRQFVLRFLCPSIRNVHSVSSLHQHFVHVSVCRSILSLSSIQTLHYLHVLPVSSSKMSHIQMSHASIRPYIYVLMDLSKCFSSIVAYVNLPMSLSKMSRVHTSLYGQTSIHPWIYPNISLQSVLLQQSLNLSHPSI